MDFMDMIMAKKLGGSGGGGADLLNENGVIKQQHLPEGYPYAEPTVFLPETEPVFSADMGGFIIMSDLDADMFIVGQSYTVNWNGTEYVSQAAVQDDGSMKAIILGDLGAMQGAPTTGEPFVVMILDAAAQAAMGIAAMVIPIDGSMSVTLSISGETVTPIDAKFLPGGRVVIITRVDDGAPSMTYADALAALKNGALLVFRDCTTSIGLIYDYSFTGVLEGALESEPEANPYLLFTLVEGSDITHLAITKILMYADGTVEKETVN